MKHAAQERTSQRQGSRPAPRPTAGEPGTAANRARVTGLALLALASLALLPSCSDEPTPSPDVSRVAQDPVREDARIAYLLVPGTRTGHYDVDTSNPTAILAEALEHGHRDPLRRAREELGALGETGLAVARRTIDAHFSNPDGGSHLRNAIDIVHRSDAPGAREVALRVLQHRDIGIAALAAAALEKHGRPEDYEILMACFDVADPEFRLRFLLAAARVDPARAQRQILEWLESGLYDGLWDECGTVLAEATAPEVVGRLSPLWRSAAPRFQSLLAAPCARAGDAEALEFLRSEALAIEPWRAEAAVTAMQRAGLADELDAAARRSPVASARMRALNALASEQLAPAHAEAFRANLNAIDEALSNAALVVLVGLGDATAIDRAIELVSTNDNTALQSGMQALREPMRRDPALAERVFAALTRRREPEATRALADQQRTLQAIGQVPTESAARSLIELARTAKGEISSMRAPRWLALQAGNTGPVGQRLLREELGLTEDPLHRIDLLEGIAGFGGPLAVEILLDFVESEQARPYELLFAAERLTRLATVAQVAPVLKRVTLRTTQPDVRIALQGLMWLNYPGPR